VEDACSVAMLGMCILYVLRQTRRTKGGYGVQSKKWRDARDKVCIRSKSKGSKGHGTFERVVMRKRSRHMQATRGGRFEKTKSATGEDSRREGQERDVLAEDLRGESLLEEGGEKGVAGGTWGVCQGRDAERD